LSENPPTLPVNIEAAAASTQQAPANPEEKKQEEPKKFVKNFLSTSLKLKEKNKGASGVPAAASPVNSESKNSVDPN
jgi:hypothetical protein